MLHHKQFFEKLGQNDINFAFLQDNCLSVGKQYCQLRISPKKDKFFCGDIGLPVEPLNDKTTPTCVIWKKDLTKDYLTRFADMLASMSKKYMSAAASAQ